MQLVLRGARRIIGHPQLFRSYHLLHSRLLVRPFASTLGQSEKVHEIKGYSLDLLDAPLLSSQNAPSKALDPAPNENWAPKDNEDSATRARRIFGAKDIGPEERRRMIEEKSQMIFGIKVPPKPDEPDNCCMSGCVNCVWDTFRDELEEWAAKSAEARAKVMEQRTSGKATGLMATEKGMPTHAAVSMDDDGGGSETNWAPSAVIPGEDILGTTSPSPDLFADIPVGIREFMKTEKRLKEKQKRNRAGAD